MPVGYEDVAVLRNGHAGRAIERIVTRTRNASLSERHEDFPLTAELENLLALAVFALSIGNPDVALGIYRQPVSLHEHPGAKAFQELARSVELEDSGIAAMEHPDVAMCIRRNGDHLPPLYARRELRPILDGAVRIGQITGGPGGGSSLHPGARNRRDNCYPKDDSRSM